MLIDDQRHKRKEIAWSEMESAQIYIAHKLQKYLIKTNDMYVVCLESGELFDQDELMGDVFTSVNARLEIY